MKHRRNKVKRKHGLIQNALLWLENLSTLEEVTDIIPGVIEVSHSSERGVVYKYETQTGCKLLAKSNGSIQEVFVVTKNPAGVQAWIKREFSGGSSSEETLEPVRKTKDVSKNSEKSIIAARRELRRERRRSLKRPNIPDDTAGKKEA